MEDHHPIPIEVQRDIQSRMDAAEAEHQVKILYAIESGSRAWGFASATSDYDVRFIYIHPRDWYLAIDSEKHRDVIEYPIVDDIDINGWDLRKALRLYEKSNPAIVEWLLSPIVYRDCGQFAKQARALLPQILATDRSIFHYRQTAFKNHRDFLMGESVPLKKYFYVLRALLAIRWIESHGVPAPIEFDKLLQPLAEMPELWQAVQALLEQKKQSTEKVMIAPVQPINRFIEAELHRLEDFKGQKQEPQSRFRLLNQLFLATLAEQAPSAI